MIMESNPQNSNKKNLTPEEQKKMDKKVRIKEFGMLRSHMNKSGLPKTSFSLQKPLQELVQQKPTESTLIDNDCDIDLPQTHEMQRVDWFRQQTRLVVPMSQSTPYITRISG